VQCQQDDRDRGVDQPGHDRGARAPRRERNRKSRRPSRAGRPSRSPARDTAGPTRHGAGSAPSRSRRAVWRRAGDSVRRCSKTFAARRVSGGMVTSRATIAASAAHAIERSRARQVHAAPARLATTPRPTSPAGYLDEAASPAAMPASHTRRPGAGALRARSARSSASSTKTVTNPSTLTSVPRIASAGSRAAAPAASQAAVLAAEPPREQRALQHDGERKRQADAAADEHQGARLDAVVGERRRRRKVRAPTNGRQTARRAATRARPRRRPCTRAAAVVVPAGIPGAVVQHQASRGAGCALHRRS
jgi:hypothetical protein